MCIRDRAPDQYDTNVKTKPGSDKLVEFAVKLPGQAEDDHSVYLPIDAKFPKDVYEQLLDAYESGDLQRVGTTSRMLEQTISGMAKDIRDKYLAPPYKMCIRDRVYNYHNLITPFRYKEWHKTNWLVPNNCDVI